MVTLLPGTARRLHLFRGVAIFAWLARCHRMRRQGYTIGQRFRTPPHCTGMQSYRLRRTSALSEPGCRTKDTPSRQTGSPSHRCGADTFLLIRLKHIAFFHHAIDGLPFVEAEYLVIYFRILLTVLLFSPLSHDHAQISVIFDYIGS